MSQHSVIWPIIWPLLVALLLMLPPFDSDAKRRRWLSIAGSAGLLLIAVALMWQASTGQSQLYQLGNWSAPFGISLLLDQASALMLLLTAGLGFAALLFASAGDDEQGPFFHSLFHFQLMGINGAFLTADLFNLFVFFEILLIASYALLIHGGGKAKTKAALHYVILNLAGSALFLIGLALMYGATGTLNMLDLAVKTTQLTHSQQLLLQASAALLLIVFGLKAAVMPLHFWLGNAYSAASPAVAALFAVMTKVGVFCLMRVFMQVFAGTDFIVSWAYPLLWWSGLLTIVLAVIALLTSEDLRKQISYLVVLSVGGLVAALSLGTAQASQAVLFYSVHSTLATAGLFLLAELIAQQRGKAADRLVTGRKVLQPMLLGISFVILALSVVGMPPFSGFIAKLLLLQAVPLGMPMFWFWSALLGSSLVLLLVLSRSGTVLFWQVSGRNLDALPAGWLRSSALVLLVAASPLLTIFAGSISHWCFSAVAQFSQLISAWQGGQL